MSDRSLPDACQGGGLRKESLAVTVGGHRHRRLLPTSRSRRPWTLWTGWS
ncbi:MAG: hypothetical protein ACLUJG_12220 [Lawsonibacter sp.]